MKIEILMSPGCVHCAKAIELFKKLKVNYKVIDITKNPRILEKYPIMMTPGIIINGKLEFQGVPKEEELRKKISKNKK